MQLSASIEKHSMADVLIAALSVRANLGHAHPSFGHGPNGELLDAEIEIIS